MRITISKWVNKMNTKALSRCISLRITPRVYEELDSMAREGEVSVSHIIREIVKEELNKPKQDRASRRFL